jgi:parvulin-like peptidyl-prolyl isomerase
MWGKLVRGFRPRFVLLAIFVTGVCYSPLLAQSSSSTTETAVPGKLQLQVIVVASLAKAQELVEQLKNGAAFAKLAREESIDPTAGDGGYMGQFT